MFGIKVNGEFLSLPGSYSISYNIKNPIFETEFIEGDFSFNFRIPTKFNNRILGYPEIINNSGLRDVTFDCELFLGNTFWQRGILIIKNGNKKSISVSINSAAGEFNVKTAAKGMNEIDYEVSGQIPESFRYLLVMPYSVPGNSTADDIFVDIDSGSFIYTQLFVISLENTLSLLAGQINADTGAHEFVAESKAAGYDPVTGNQLGFIYIHNETFGDKQGVTLTLTYSGLGGGIYMDDWMTQIDNDSLPIGLEEAIQQHMTYHLDWERNGINNYRLFFDKRQYVFPEFLNDNAFNGQAEFSGAVEDVQRGNLYNSGTQKYIYEHSISLATPFPFVEYVLTRILKDSDYELSGTAFNDEEIKNLVIYNNYTLDNVSDVLPDTLIGDIIDFDNHVSTFQCGDFFKGLKNMFAWAVFFDSNASKCRIFLIKDILNDPDYEDWTDKAEPYNDSDVNDETETNGFLFTFTFDSSDEYTSTRIKAIDSFTQKPAVIRDSNLPTSGNEAGDIRLILLDNDWVIVNTQVGPQTWRFLSEFLLDHKIANGLNIITSQISPVFLKLHPFYEPGTIDLDTLIPIVKQPVTTVMGGLDNPGFMPRITFWRGKFQDLSAKDYPLASYDVYDEDFNKIADYAIKWDGEFGLINTWWKEYIQWKINTRLITHMIRLSKTDLLNLKLWKKIRIDGIDYLIKSLKITFTETETDFVIAEADLSTVGIGTRFLDDIVTIYEDQPESSPPE